MKIRQFAIPPVTMPEIKGIMANGCIAKQSLSNVMAHAHSSTKDEFFGWICSREIETLGEISNVRMKSENVLEMEILSPSVLLWHEYAHLLVPDYGHGYQFVQCLRKLGQHSEADRYDKSVPKQMAAGNWLVRDRFRVKDDAIVPHEFIGQTGQIIEVRRLKVVVQFDKLATRMNLWPVSLLERI